MKLEDFGIDAMTLPGPLDGKLDAIRKAGFGQVMLSAADLAGYPGGADAAIRTVRESGLRVTGLQLLRDYEGLAGRLHDYKVDVAKSMLEMAHATGAPLLLVCSTTSTHASGDFETQVADLRKLAMLAVPLRVRIAYEALSWGRFVDDLPSAWALVQAVDRANLGLAIDAFHFVASGTSLDTLEEVYPSKLFLVQLSDFMGGAPATADERRETARHFRVFPGEGSHSEAIAELIRAVDRLGYEGDFSFEVFNDDYRQMEPSRVVRRARRALEWITSHVSRRSLPVRRPASMPHHRDAG